MASTMKKKSIIKENNKQGWTIPEESFAKEETILLWELQVYERYEFIEYYRKVRWEIFTTPDFLMYQKPAETPT